MVAPKLPDADFIRLFTELGPAEMARRVGQGTRRIMDRRRNLEMKYKRQIASPVKSRSSQPVYQEHPGRICLDVEDGVVLVGSDWHIWPGPASLMHRAFVMFCKELNPKVVIANGDIVDLACISRHPPIGWEKHPTVQEEIEAAQDRLHEIEKASGKARKLWPVGNHDSRFSTRLATVAPEYAEVAGTHLQDHFPLWEPCWRVDINGDVIVKHRGKGGKHDAYNNALHAGVTVVTGHSHSPFVREITDVRGSRFGVNCGCIADPDHRAFLDYTEDSPYKDWRAAMAVLTFKDKRLKPPELVTKWDAGSIIFRGEVLHV